MNRIFLEAEGREEGREGKDCASGYIEMDL